MTSDEENLTEAPFARHERLLQIESWYRNSKLSMINVGEKQVTLFMGADAQFEESTDVYPSVELVARIALAIHALCPGDKVYEAPDQATPYRGRSMRLPPWARGSKP